MVISYRAYSNLLTMPVSCIIGIMIGRLIVTFTAEQPFVPEFTFGFRVFLTWALFNLLSYYTYLFLIFLKMKVAQHGNS